MAKLRSAEIEVADIAEYVATQDDFAFELQVYREAVRAGLTVSHSGGYVDNVTGKFRQYDIQATMERDDRTVALAVECKCLKRSFPLLVSRLPRTAEESRHHLLQTHGPRMERTSLGTRMSTSKVLTRQGRDSIYVAGRPVGKATAQVGRNDKGELIANDSEAFEKWAQALASCAHIAQTLVSARRPRGVIAHITAVLPVLVVPDRTLWAVDYTTAGTAASLPHLVEEVELFVDRQLVQKGPALAATHLHICTLSGAKSIFRRLARGKRYWSKLLPPAATPKSGGADA